MVEVQYIHLSNRIIISDGDGNIRQRFDNSGIATFLGSATNNVNSRYSVIISDNSAVAAGNGGGIIFRGKYTGTTLIDGGGINLYKENSTDGEYGYGLNFTTRENSGNLTTRLTLAPSGNVGIGTNNPTYKFETLGTSVITAAFGRSDYGVSNVMLIAMNGYRDVYKQAIGVVRTDVYDIGDIIFCLNGSGNSTVVSASDEKVRITSGGVLQAKYGISFPNAAAAGGTIAATPLNAYEEGTWTPIINQGGANVTLTHSYGTYTRVGNLLHISFYLFSNTPNSLSGSWVVKGLPYSLKF
jgi:hypothetical protein